MPNNLSVTFAIICYNYGRYLRRALESCLIQRSPDVKTEVLVLDDGSTDETPEICKKYAGKIKVSRSENFGFGATLTRAVREGSGDWIFFLDADDFFAPTKLTAFFPYLRDGLLFVSDRPQCVNQAAHPIKQTILQAGCTSTLAICRKAALDLLPVENELYFHVLARPGKGILLAETHTFYRLHDANMTNRRSPGVWNSYLACMTHRLADRLEKLSLSPPGWLGAAEDARALANRYRAQAWYNELEAALECKLFTRAWGRWFRMVAVARRSDEGIRTFHWKMFLRTTLLKPSFPK